VADHYELTKSKDGVQRLTLKVEHRLTLYDISVVLAASIDHQEAHEDPEGYANWVWKSRRDVMHDVRRALDKRTLEGSHNYVGSYHLEGIQQAFLDRISKLW